MKTLSQGTRRSGITYGYFKHRLEEETKQYKQEIGRLKFIINEFNECYIKVMTKCDEMIKNRRYMSDIAIQMYATDIKDICHFYADKAIRIEIRGSISNE